MNINEFVKQFTNHPVLFVGTGISLRYLQNSFTWDGLLAYISRQLKGNDEFYYDIKSKYEKNGVFDYPKIALDLESEFDLAVKADRNGSFKGINDAFYDNMKNNINISRFKLYIATLLKDYSLKTEKMEEINELKKVRKNIGSVITTNYDSFVEDIFEFNALIGNDILLSNPYGSVYKIHGCVDDPSKIIITDNDYVKFNEKYELIRAQLLSLFIHNPIIFLGYNIGDNNIKSLLKTIFTYIEPNSEQADKIRANFLLVEYESGSMNVEVVDHDIDIDGFSTIRINKIKTDNFFEIYNNLANLKLPISAMDVRKVSSVVQEIYSGGEIQVSITEDIDLLKNGQTILAIGSLKTITYEFHTTAEMMEDYFKIIEESNDKLLQLIDKQRIQQTQYFPIFGFGLIQTQLEKYEELKGNQLEKIRRLNEDISKKNIDNRHTSIKEILEDEFISATYKNIHIISAVINDQIELNEVEKYLREYPNKEKTEYRKLLSVYDYNKYSGLWEEWNLANN